jgi:hypothetical protein
MCYEHMTNSDLPITYNYLLKYIYTVMNLSNKFNFRVIKIINLETNIDLSGRKIPDGIYFAKICIDKSIITKKFILCRNNA